MSNYKFLYLSKGREVSVLRRHPWIFSGGIKKADEGIKNGDPVLVKSFKDEIVATGHYQNGSIMCRILSFSEAEINIEFYTNKFKNALDYRLQNIGIPNNLTNAYRLIHGEGDGLPGLIIDIYNNTAVVQAHSVGMAKDTVHIIEALKNVFTDNLTTIYNRSKEASYYVKDGLLWGEDKQEDIVLENGKSFLVNWAEGQKTGFFLDQRDNRKLVGDISKGNKVLNLFSYTGGFSIYAMTEGATQVDSIDISDKATLLLDNNVALLSDPPANNSITANVMEYLKEYEGELPFDIIIVDPPAFAKSMKKRHNAIQAYKRLNEAVISKAKKGAVILTFSCSQVVDTALFTGAIVSAGIDAQRDIRIMKQLSQGPDHPINLFHPEGHYLKGLMLSVE